jgi:alcohol dehydrogenase class IV
VNTITLLQPPRIIFGNGCANRCVELFADRRIGAVLLVTSSAVLPLLGPLLEALKQARIDVIHSRPVDSEPTLAFFDEVLNEAKAAEMEAVLGVGGGSAMDVAKLVAALARGKQTTAEVFGINLLASRELFLVCLPTTSGTGSEVSPNSILLDEADELKKGAVSPHLVPDAAIVDPLLTVSLPPSVTAATGLDALTHCIEAYANKFAHPAVDVYALAGIRLIGGYLLRAVRNGNDIEAREHLALGSLYGGLCLGPVNTAAVHALAYPLGGQFHVAHGVSNAVLLPHVLRFNLPNAAQRYAGIAEALDLSGNGSISHLKSTLESRAEQGISSLIQLSRDCGIPQHLADLGVPRSALPSMAKSAMQVTRLLKNNLRPLTEEDALRIYEASY